MPVKYSKKSDLTAERLREVLSYDPETGVFRWRNLQGRRMKVGDVAGHKDHLRLARAATGAFYKVDESSPTL